MEPAERHARLRLAITPGFGPRLIGEALEHFGSAVETTRADEASLARLSGVGRARARKLRHALDEQGSEAALEAQNQRLEALGGRALLPEDEAFPRLLRFIPDPPPALFVRGAFREDDALALAVVGARRCTGYGREQADRFAAYAAEAGLTVISGGARGIDAAAHRAALRVRGRTVAVLGSGLGRPYPPEHAELFEQIAGEDCGCVVSELPVDAAPAAEHFPRRNRLVSGLALGVLVVEASARSGARITARLAAEEHGREVMAVPGRVDAPASRGCHEMIREGWAALVASGAHVLECLGEAGTWLEAGEDETAPAAGPAESGLTASQRAIVAALAEPRPLDGLVEATGAEAAQIQSDLAVLEIRGLVKREAGLFRRA